MLQNYDEWDFHGDPSVQGPTDEYSQPQNDTGRHADMNHLIHDTFAHMYDDFPMADGTNNANPPVDEANSEAQEFYKMVKDSEKPLWEGCELSELSLLVLLFNVKSMNKWIDKSFSDLLAILHMAIPNENQLPRNFYEAKKVISKFGLGYEMIHACSNNCQLFWKDKANDDFCSTCKASRWKGKEPETKLTLKERRKARPCKVLRYFLIKDWLKRLFMCKETAPLLRWHDEKRINGGYLRHPADSKAWKSFDERENAAEIKRRNHNRRLTPKMIEQVQLKDFPNWFRDHIMQLEQQNGSDRIDDEIRWLARGPLDAAIRHRGFNNCGYRFRAKLYDKVTQNSEVVMTPKTSSYASASDRNPTLGDVMYYGRILDITELDYYGKFSVVLFKCEWPDLADSSQGKVAWRGDALNQLLGEDKLGRVHGLGLVPNPNEVFDISTSWHFKNINLTSLDPTSSEDVLSLRFQMEKVQKHVQTQDATILELKQKTRILEERQIDQSSLDDPVQPPKSIHVNGTNTNRKRVYCQHESQEFSMIEQHINMKRRQSYDNSERTNKYSNTHQNKRETIRNEMGIAQQANKHPVANKSKENMTSDGNGLQAYRASNEPYIARYSYLQDDITVEKTCILIETRLQIFETQTFWSNHEVPHYQGKNLSKGDCAAKQHHGRSKSTTNSIKVGSTVFLKSLKNQNKKIAIGIVESCDPTYKLDGVPIGNEFWIVRVSMVIAADEELIRPYKTYNLIGDALGANIAWPSTCTEKTNW